MIQIHDFVQSLARNSIPLWFEKNYDVNLTLCNMADFLKTFEKCPVPCLGNCCQFVEGFLN